MPGLNCWEYKRCGREPGGVKVAEMGVCPATVDVSSNGLNGGRNGGRICWAVTGTLCDGTVQGTFAQKHLSCMTCEFFGKVKEEGAGQFLLLKPGQARRSKQTAGYTRMEAVLSKENDHLTALLNSLPVVAYATRAGGNVALTYVSENVASFAGYRPDDFIEDPSFWAERIHPDDAPRVMADVSRGIQSGKLQTEYRWRVADGSYRWCRNVAQVVRSPNGGPSHFVGTWEDVTKERQLREELRAADLIMENSKDLISVVDARTFRYLAVSKSLLKRFDKPEGEVLGQTCHKLVFGLDEPCAGAYAPCPLLLARESGRPATVEKFHDAPDGTRTYLEVTASPVNDADGSIPHVVYVVRDISDRKRLESVAEQERQRLQALGEATPVGVLVVDAASRRVILANRETGRMLGVARGPDDHLDKYRRGIVYRRADGGVYPIAELPLERALREGENVRAEEVGFELSDGRSFLGLVSASPVHSADGRISAAICIIQDMTPLEEIEKLRGEFLGMVSHELKTPLAAIKGAAATVMGSADPFSATETRELFSIINSQADRLRGMVDNMLQMASIESGALSIAPAPTELGALLREAVASFARGGGDREIQMPDMHVCPVVQADGVRIKQVLTNLLSNAAKFSSPASPVTITVEQQADHAIINVRDQGRGISGEKLSHLFKKFSRIHEGSDTKLSGSGLGLAISKGIVEAHGGRIWATSAGEQQGSTFSFTLPVAVQQPAAHGATQDVDAPGRPSDASAERTRVLVVDDDMSALRTTQHHLRQAGFQPVLAGNATEVVSLIERKKPAFVLLTLGLLETNSLDLLRHIRSVSNVPVILLTGSEDQDIAVQALDAGADDYVTRPFSPFEFRARVAAALHRRTTSGSALRRPPFSLEDVRINFEERRVSVKGREVHLSATEYKLLCELAAHAGQVLTHDQLLQRVWGQEYSGEPELVRSFIRRLRRKLGDDAHCPRCIITERQVGYRMPRPS